jgi:TonB-dependent receptor
MMQRIHRTFALAVALLCLAAAAVLAQGSANVTGVIKDAQTGEPLPGANVLLMGTGMGSTTDIEGKYAIRHVPTGTYTLRVTYVGYTTITTTISVKDGIDVRKDFKMSSVAIEGETVVVTAQAAGQNEAINQQLTSMPVMNVVSAARIQELPDANAAESVSRLPGVSLIRTGGEGSQVVIRGLSPQYNQVTIDGVELPSDVPSSNRIVSVDQGAQEGQSNVLGDRANDLSMISSSMLGGIEVIKAITPDMDAAVLGGVVNFGLRKAAKNRTVTDGIGTWIDQSWFPSLDFKIQGGYNNLKNTKSDYRFVGSLERRFLDERFGVFAQASAEQRNLSANELSVSYALNDKDKGDAGIPDLSSMTIMDYFRTRSRLGATVVLDFQHDNGDIGLMNFVSSSKTRTVNRGESISPTPPGYGYYPAGQTDNKLTVLSNLLSVKQEISIFHTDLRLSHSYSESHNPEDLSFGFEQVGTGYDNMPNIIKQHPHDIWSLFKADEYRATMAGISTSESFSRERTLTGSLDFQTEVPVLDWMTAKVKFGGSWQHRSRSYDFEQSSGTAWHDDVLTNNLLKFYPWVVLVGGYVGMPSFAHANYDFGKVLNGDYGIKYPIDVAFMQQIMPLVKGLNQGGYRGGYRYNYLASSINDYDGTEDKSAGYVMATLNIGDRISILPGVRYQNLTTEYHAQRGRVTPANTIQGSDTTVTQSHGNWLPMLHLRYVPTDWLQLHFAYTNTLNYADYSALTPRYLIETSFITYNNIRIKPATSENLDFVAALHSNEIGLFTVDVFRKKIKDLIFFYQTWATNVDQYPELPPLHNTLIQFNTYINNPKVIDLYGVETEWQTHFWYLPQPFTGLVLNLNYTHIFSQAVYPKSAVEYVYYDDGTFNARYYDTSYTTRMLNQPNDIVNITLGYDYAGFSARVSMLYQDNIFKQPDFWSQLRNISAKYTRWDLSVRQQLPWYGLQVFLNVNNLTGENELTLNPKTGFPASEQRYGMSADLGVGIRL